MMDEASSMCRIFAPLFFIFIFTKIIIIKNRLWSIWSNSWQYIFDAFSEYCSICCFSHRESTFYAFFNFEGQPFQFIQAVTISPQENCDKYAISSYNKEIWF